MSDVGSLGGRVALVTDAGRGLGRAIALSLAARGARVLVTGAEERPLGETVGEIAYGGGKARHLAGDVADPAFREAVLARAIELFGGLDVVVAAGVHAREMLATAASRVRPGGRFVLVGAVGEAATVEVRPPGGTANVVLAAPDVDELAASEIAALLCTPGGARVHGRVLTVA